MRVHWKLSSSLAAAILGMASMSAHANLVTNGGFETGDFTGWTVNASATLVVTNAFGHGLDAHSGTYFAALGDISPTFPYGTLSQTIADTAGQTYTLSYWLASDGDLPNYFDATWNGTLISGSEITDSASTPYINYTFNVLGTGSDTLLFNEQDVPGYWALDDVSLDPTTTSAPEPGTLALLGAGLVAIGLLGSKRRHRMT